MDGYSFLLKLLKPSNTVEALTSRGLLCPHRTVAEFLCLIVKYFYYGKLLTERGGDREREREREREDGDMNIHVTNNPVSTNLDCTFGCPPL